MTTDNSESAHGSVWNSHAAQWSRLGAPLRPSPEDIRGYEGVVGRWAEAHGRPRIVLLGVTPEIVGMHMPQDAHLVAVDINQAMLEAFPPALLRPGSKAICADWRRMPLEGGSCDIILCDGGFLVMDFPEGFRKLARELRRVLAENGVCAFRFFLQPETAESTDDLTADLRAGRIGGFHAFKLRAAMALQESAESGIAVSRVFEWWSYSSIAPEELTVRYGWPPETIATIDAYRDRPDIYSFPTLGELRDALGDLFVETDCRFPGYELGERCPLIELRPAGRAERGR
jgi:SAM-dependent methyltransferase